MKIAIIILHYGSFATTKHALADLAKKIGDNELILINNTSDDISPLSRMIPGTKLINNPRNLGFAKGVNQGIRLALKDKSLTHFFLMNNDLVLSSGSFAQLLLTLTNFPQQALFHRSCTTEISTIGVANTTLGLAWCATKTGATNPRLPSPLPM